MFHVKHYDSTSASTSDETLGAHLRNLNISTKSIALLEAFANALLNWQRSHNLVGPAEIAKIWNRHIRDSLQLLSLASDAKKWLDIGTGNGFPAVVIAATLTDTDGALVHCVESDARKCAFLAAVTRDLCLPIVIHARRFETIDPPSILPVDAITSRAFGSMSLLGALTKPYLISETVGIFPIGRTLDPNIGAIFNECVVEVHTSAVDGNSKILRILAPGRTNS